MLPLASSYNDERLRRLIINADDFGLTAGINRAILEAHSRGIDTSATLMASGPAFQSAVESAKTAPQLGVGCHVVLVDGTPVLPPAEIPTLTAQSGAFRPHLAGFALAALAGRLAPEEIEAEASAQIRKLQAAGIAVTHFDSHKHAHMFTHVIRPLLRAAWTCGVKAVRNPFEPVRLVSVAGQPRLWKRALQVRSLGLLATRFRNQVQNAGMTAPDGTLGIVATGSLDEKQLHSLLRQCPEGTWELVCHPGYDDAELRQVKTTLRASRLTELQALTSDATRRLIAGAGIELISYRDLK